MNTRSMWEDMRKNIKETVEKSIGYLKLILKKPWKINDIMELVKQINHFKKKDETKYRIIKKIE